MEIKVINKLLLIFFYSLKIIIYLITKKIIQNQKNESN